MRVETKRKDLIYSDEVYKIMGAVFDVYKELGFGYRENIYQKAIAKQFKEKGIKFKEQFYYSVEFHNETVGKNYFDFLVDNKIILEIKVRNYFSKKDIEQLSSYLKASGLKLGIIIHITRDGVKFKRIANII
jgi:GxxExxY protein